MDRRRRELSCSRVILVETSQLGQPSLPLLLGGQEVIAHVAQKLHFHHVNFLHSKAGHLSPRLVGVRVVVQNCQPVSCQPKKKKAFSHLSPQQKPRKMLLHLLPSIRATVSRRYSLPARPLICGVDILRRYMKRRARKMTFCVTWVVDRTL